MKIHNEFSESSNGVFRLFVGCVQGSDPLLLFHDDEVLVVEFLLHLLLGFDVVDFNFVVELLERLELVNGGLEFFNLLALVHVALCQIFQHLFRVRSSIKLSAEIFGCALQILDTL